MNWINEYKLIENTTHLGKRESQVLTLDKREYNAEQIKTKISDLEGESPKINTIESIKSKLKRKRIKSVFTNNAITTNNLILPCKLNNEFNREQTVYSYIGQIGCGKTVTAADHTVRLSENDNVDRIDILSPIEKEWDYIDNINDNKISTYYPKSTSSKEEIKEYLIDQLFDCIESYDSSYNCAIFIDQAYYILNDDKYVTEIKNKLDDLEANISLRLIVHDINDINNINLDIDVYNIFRLSSNDNLKEIIDEKLTISPKNLHIGREEEPWSEVIQVNKLENNYNLYCSYITDENQYMFFN